MRESVADHPEYGDLLVGPNGMTVYMFEQETQSDGASTCYDDCARAWPPVTVDAEPTAGDGVTTELSIFERESGERQVMANGWSLYYFAQDEAPDDATEHGINEVWWVLGPDGTSVGTGE